MMVSRRAVADQGQGLITKHQLAKWLRVSEATINRMMSDGLPHHRLGTGYRLVRYDLGEVMAWLRKRRDMS